MAVSGTQFPVDAQCYSISVTNSASTSQALPASGDSIRFVNEGTAIVYVSVGSGTQTATVPVAGVAAKTRTCTPILPSTDVSFSLASFAGASTPLNISAIAAVAGPTLLNVMVGQGV
jgi:hypothetical protein